MVGTASLRSREGVGGVSLAALAGLAPELSRRFSSVGGSASQHLSLAVLVDATDASQASGQRRDSRIRLNPSEMGRSSSCGKGNLICG
jgi:hypothetical protein